MLYLTAVEVAIQLLQQHLSSVATVFKTGHGQRRIIVLHLVGLTSRGVLQLVGLMSLVHHIVEVTSRVLQLVGLMSFVLQLVELNVTCTSASMTDS